MLLTETDEDLGKAEPLEEEGTEGEEGKEEEEGAGEGGGIREVLAGGID